MLKFPLWRLPSSSPNAALGREIRIPPDVCMFMQSDGVGRNLRSTQLFETLYSDVCSFDFRQKQRSRDKENK